MTTHLSKTNFRKVSIESTAYEPDGTAAPADRLPRLEPRDLAADPLAMRALAHPTRIRLMEELTLRGQMTATEAAEHVGESPSSCSFHLRMLAKYGFVEEAEGGAGRRRPWRVVAVGSRWSSGPDTEAAERAAGDLLGVPGRRRDDGLLDEHLPRRDELPDEWTAVVHHASFDGWLTPAELGEIGERLLEMWRPFLARLRDPAERPPGSRLVHMSVHGFPRADFDQQQVGPQATTETANGDADA